jgi:hypothetical protein
MVRTHRAWKTFDRRTMAAALSIMLAWRDEKPNLDFGIVDSSCWNLSIGWPGDPRTWSFGPDSGVGSKDDAVRPVCGRLGMRCCADSA